MTSRWLLSGLSLGVLVAAGLAVAPAFGAPERSPTMRVIKAAPMSFGTFGTFTPAAADPRLAAALGRGGLSTSGFRFTPSGSPRSSHAVTVAMRARSSRSVLAAARVAEASAAPASVSLTPVAYNLGLAVGWRRFALSGDVVKLDLAGAPGSREAADVGVSYTGKRFGAQVKAATDRPLANSLPLVERGPAYSVDLAGSYRLTHNLDVTAGVRYKTERDRLQNLTPTEDRRDSQAVYIGTAFRF